MDLLVVEGAEDCANVVEFDGELGKRSLRIGGVVIGVDIFPGAQHFNHHHMTVPLKLVVTVPSDRHQPSGVDYLI